MNQTIYKDICKFAQKDNSWKSWLNSLRQMKSKTIPEWNYAAKYSLDEWTMMIVNGTNGILRNQEHLKEITNDMQLELTNNLRASFNLPPFDKTTWDNQYAVMKRKGWLR